MVCILLKKARKPLKLFLEDKLYTGRLYRNNQQFNWRVYRQKLPDVDFENLALAVIKGIEDYPFFAPEGESDRLYLAEKRLEAPKIVSEA